MDTKYNERGLTNTLASKRALLGLLNRQGPAPSFDPPFIRLLIRISMCRADLWDKVTSPRLWPGIVYIKVFLIWHISYLENFMFWKDLANLGKQGIDRHLAEHMDGNAWEINMPWLAISRSWLTWKYHPIGSTTEEGWLAILILTFKPREWCCSVISSATILWSAFLAVLSVPGYQCLENGWLLITNQRRKASIRLLRLLKLLINPPPISIKSIRFSTLTGLQMGCSSQKTGRQ